MKISTERPPIYDEANKLFKIEELGLKPCFAYGSTIYNPFNVIIDADLEAHEAVHSGRQGDNPKEWWDQYLADRDFRLQEEILAYAAQLKVLYQNAPNAHGRDYYLDKVSEALSGNLYGNLCTFGEARSKIRRASMV